MSDFRDRFLAKFAELEAQGQTRAAIARRAGVKADVIRDLQRRPDSTTSTERAAALARAVGIEVTPDIKKGFSEPPAAPVRDVFAALDEITTRSETAGTTPTEKQDIKIAVVGDTIQIFATVDEKTLPELLRRLTLAHHMIRKI